MVPKIKSFEHLGSYVVDLTFNNKKHRIVNLEPYLRGKRLKPILNPDLFYEMFIEDGGGLAWPSGADLCPNMLYHSQPTASVEA